MIRILAWGAALAMMSIWLLIIGFTLPVFNSGQALAVFSWNWSPDAGQYGILPMLCASLMLSLSALALAWPLAIGIACRLQLSQKSNGGLLSGLIRFMTTIPTVVYGFTSIFLLTPLVREARGQGSGLCWFTALLVLALLILPTMVLVLDGALKSVSKRTALGMAALGFSPEQHLACLVLPTSRRWLVSAAVLGFGRAVGDTLIALMLSGNAPQVPSSLFGSLRTLSAHMTLVTAAEVGGDAYNSLFMAAGLLLLISFCASLALRRLTHTTHAPETVSALTLPPFFGVVLRYWSKFSTICVCTFMLLLVGFLLWRGMSTLSLSLFFGETPPLLAISGQSRVWEGIWPACVGTLALLTLTMLLALGPGIGCGIYLAEYAPVRVRAFFSLLVDSMAGMPSIVMGFFGLLLIMLLRRSVWPGAGPGLLLAALCMALLVLPVLIVSTRNALESLPQSLRLTGHALGLSPAQTMWHLLLPQASGGILGGVILAMSRAAEDTAVILLTGAVANAGLPGGLGMRFEALPFMIYYTAAQYQDAAELARGFGAALVLLFLSCLLLSLTTALQKRYIYRHERGYTR